MTFDWRADKGYAHAMDKAIGYCQFVIFLCCWLGGGIAEGMLFPASDGTIGFAVGFFGGMGLAHWFGHYAHEHIQFRHD
jgi:hypothetical protein